MEKILLTLVLAISINFQAISAEPPALDANFISKVKAYFRTEDTQVAESSLKIIRDNVPVENREAFLELLIPRLVLEKQTRFVVTDGCVRSFTLSRHQESLAQACERLKPINFGRSFVAFSPLEVFDEHSTRSPCVELVHCALVNAIEEFIAGGGEWVL